MLKWIQEKSRYYYIKSIGYEMRIVLLLLFIVLQAEAIITIAPIVIGKKVGFTGLIEGSLETKRGNTQKEEYKLGIKAQYDNNESYLIFTDLIVVYGEASGERNTNKTYAHIRYIYKLTNAWNPETYFQSETNEFTSVDC